MEEPVAHSLGPAEQEALKILQRLCENKYLDPQSADDHTKNIKEGHERYPDIRKVVIKCNRSILAFNKAS